MVTRDRPGDRIPFVLLEIATLLSGAGNGAAAVVLPWLVLERTQSATSAGVLAAATAVPLLASSLFSGTIVDRFGRRRISIGSDVLSAVSVAAIPLIDYTLGLDLAWLVGLAVIGAVFDPAGVTARETMLPAAATRAGWTLDQVNGVHEATWSVAFLIGPGVGGILIAWIGAVNALWVTAIGFVLSAAAVGVIRVDVTTTSARPAVDGGIWSGTRDGLQFLWRDRLLRTLLVVSAVIVSVYMPIEGVLLPVHFEDLAEPGRLGFVIMAMSAGGVVGALGYALLASRLRRTLAFRLAYLFTAGSLLVMAFLPAYPILLLAAFGLGTAYGPVGPLVNLAMQTRSPEEMRGRVVGLMTSTEYAAGPFGYLVVGASTQAFGVEPTFLVLAGLILVVALATLGMSSLRELDDLADDVEAVHGLADALDVATGATMPLVMPPRDPDARGGRPVR